jgi:uncharacterized protein YoaH (UPF0181 family)
MNPRLFGAYLSTVKSADMSSRLEAAGSNIARQAGGNALGGAAVGLGVGLNRIARKGYANMDTKEILLHLLALPVAGAGIGSVTGAGLSGLHGLILPKQVMQDLREEQESKKKASISPRLFGAYLSTVKSAHQGISSGHAIKQDEEKARRAKLKKVASINPRIFGALIAQL